MGTMGEVSGDYRDTEEDQWMEQQSSARLFERSRIKVLAGSWFYCVITVGEHGLHKRISANDKHVYLHVNGMFYSVLTELIMQT